MILVHIPMPVEAPPHFSCEALKPVDLYYKKGVLYATIKNTDKDDYTLLAVTVYSDKGKQPFFGNSEVGHHQTRVIRIPNVEGRPYKITADNCLLDIKGTG